MTLRFASLGSGSRGNALLVEADDTLLMIDCGLRRKVVEERFRELGRSPQDVTAVLVSHEHSDHVQGVGPFTRRYRAQVFATAGTASAVPSLPRVKRFSSHRPLEIGAVSIEPFPVPHDAREPCQFVVSHGKRKLGVLSDTGHITPHIVERLAGCDALAVEFNHDFEMLMAGPYPESVKARVGSRIGHLNNAQTGGLINEVRHGGLQWVVGLHLSERNNSPELARAAGEAALAASDCRLHLATQDAPCDWLEVE